MSDMLRLFRSNEPGDRAKAAEVARVAWCGVNAERIFLRSAEVNFPRWRLGRSGAGCGVFGLGRPAAPARCRQRRGDESLGADVLGDELGVLTQAVAGALDLDDHGVVQEPIEERGGNHRVAEDLAPLGKAPIGGEDHGAPLVASVDQLEEQAAAIGDDRQVADLVDDQERGTAEEADLVAQPALALGLGECGDEVGERDEVDAAPGLDRLDPEGDRKVALAGAGGPSRWTTSWRSTKSSWARARTRLRSSDGWKVKSKPASVLMVESLAITSAVLTRRFSRIENSSASSPSIASSGLSSPRSS